MATVQHRQPVVVRHPETDMWITLSRGMDFEDDHPVVKAFGWAFEEAPAPERVTSVALADVMPKKSAAKKA